MNYKGFSTTIYTSDTIQVIKYKGIVGMFADSAASVRIVRKVMLADSISKINIKQSDIIKRDQTLRANAITIEKSFKKYQINEEIIKSNMIKDFNKKLNKKKLEIWGYRIGIGVYVITLILPLLKL